MTAEAKNVLIHIGFIKSGSTTLQQHLFGAEKTGFWTAAPSSKSGKARAKFGSYNFFLASDGGFLTDDQFDVAETRRQISLDSMPANHCLIVSNERFSGHPLSNGIDRPLICERLRRTFPNAKILLVIREQVSMIVSNYLSYLVHGGSLGIKSFLFPKNDGCVPSRSLRFWEYHSLIQTYQDAFGPENVLVLPFEMLAEDLDSFCGKVASFSGLSAALPKMPRTRMNVSAKYFSHSILRHVSPLLMSSRGNGFSLSLLGADNGKRVYGLLNDSLDAIAYSGLDSWTKKRWTKKVDQLIGGSYAESNLAVEALTGLRLERFGYRLPVQATPSPASASGR
jgi:hypothetical protein